MSALHLITHFALQLWDVTFFRKWCRWPWKMITWEITFIWYQDDGSELVSPAGATIRCQLFLIQNPIGVCHDKRDEMISSDTVCQAQWISPNRTAMKMCFSFPATQSEACTSWIDSHGRTESRNALAVFFKDAADLQVSCVRCTAGGAGWLRSALLALL